VQQNYDASSRPLCTTLRMNSSLFSGTLPDACSLGAAGAFGNDRIARTNYDSYDRAVSIVRAFGSSVPITDAVTTYTPNGQVLTIADGKGNKTTYEYDGHDRAKKTRFPSPTTPGSSSTTDYEELVYDLGSRVISRRLRDGASIAFTYDNRDRLTFVDIPGGTADDVTKSYDVMGRPLTSAIPGHTTTLEWDMLGRLLSERTQRGTFDRLIRYQWDLAGRRTRITWPTTGGATALYASYSYLTTGEMTEIRENASASGTNVLARYSYDNLGRRTSLARAGGTAMTTSYAYPAADVRLSQMAHNIAGTADDLTLDFRVAAWSRFRRKTASHFSGKRSGGTPGSQIAARTSPARRAKKWFPVFRTPGAQTRRLQRL
jgi:YD repeat-containing protein